jgi:Putative Ig domain
VEQRVKYRTLGTITVLLALCLTQCGGAGDQSITEAASSPASERLTFSLNYVQGEVQSPFSAMLQAKGGKAPYSWALVSGNLPGGLKLDARQGTIAGVPTEAGNFAVSVQVQDSSRPSPKTFRQDFSLSIVPAVQVVTTELYASYIQQPYQATLSAVGGVAPYTWSVMSGRLPQGVTLDGKTGKVIGTATEGGQFTVTFQARDSLQPAGAAVTKNFNLSIANLRLDQYGGLADAPVAGGATGYFHTAKVGSRWVLVDPLGNAFWMLSVYTVNQMDGGKTYDAAIQKKYGDNKFTFTTQALRRLRSWGFNTIGEYFSSYAPPIGMYGRKEGNSEKMPFITLVNVSYGCLKQGAVKDIYNGMNTSVYTGYRGTLVDAFDPHLQGCAVGRIQTYATNFSGGAAALSTSPWLMGVTMDDADYTSGFRSQVTHVHPGWLTAVTSPTQSGNSKYNLTYSDKTVYTKLAFRDFMKARYHDDINALNASWGSNYTTFDSAGGWGVGTGLLDEDGHNPWIHTSVFYGPPTDLPANVLADLNAWMLEFARKYFQVITSASRTVLPNHMVFGPASFDAQDWPQVLQAAGENVDMLQLQTPSTAVGDLGTAYDFSKKPCFVWTSFGSQRDSPFDGQSSGRRADFDNPTQEARGQKYADYLQGLFNVRGSDGTSPVVGIDWWELVDKVVGGEHADFGLVTYSGDNAYDGIEDRTAKGVDPWGYPVGGEAGNYGNFLGSAQRANLGTLRALLSEVTTKAGSR